MSDCPFELCDGTGFLFDEETNTAYDCRCRPQTGGTREGAESVGGDPRRYRDVSFERPPVSDIEPAIVAATRRYAATIEDQLDAGRGLWFMGPPEPARRRSRCSSRKAAMKTGRSVAIYSLPRLLNEIRDTHRSERSHIDLLDRLTRSTCCTSTTWGPSGRPTGCSRSCTRSSTAATRTSGRS